MSRPVRFNVHPIQADIKDNISLANTPEGYTGEGFFATQLSSVVGLARKNSLWPLPFATSCCGIEFMAVMASHYDLARFGAERLAFSPRQCDLLMVMGTIAKKMGPIVKQVYLQMAEPRWVMAVGACASSGGIFDTYSVLQGIDQVIPVDVYVPGCPPGRKLSWMGLSGSRTWWGVSRFAGGTENSIKPCCRDTGYSNLAGTVCSGCSNVDIVRPKLYGINQRDNQRAADRKVWSAAHPF